VIVLLLVSAVGLTACGHDIPVASAGGISEGSAGDVSSGPTAQGDGRALADCVDTIRYLGRTYLGVQIPGVRVPGVRVAGTTGQAVTMPCNDMINTGDHETGFTREEPPDPFPVLRIRGLDPAVAVATEAAGGYRVWYLPADGWTIPAEVERLIGGAVLTTS
jgi:hypothetical protein